MDKHLISLSIFTTSSVWKLRPISQIYNVLSPCSYCIFSPYMTLMFHKLLTIYYKRVLRPIYKFLTSMNHNHFLTGLVLRWDLLTVLAACECRKLQLLDPWICTWSHLHNLISSMQAPAYEKKTEKRPGYICKATTSSCAWWFERENLSASSAER